MVFQIGTRRLAIRREIVRELLRAVAPMPLPGAPVDVDGVIDVRGELLPVYDLSHRLGIEPRDLDPGDHMLVCDLGARGMAVVRADRVLEIREIAANQTSSVPIAEPIDPLVQRLVRLPDGVLLVCELAAFLSAEDAASVARAVLALERSAIAETAQ